MRIYFNTVTACYCNLSSKQSSVSIHKSFLYLKPIKFNQMDSTVNHHGLRKMVTLIMQIKRNSSIPPSFIYSFIELALIR